MPRTAAGQPSPAPHPTPGGSPGSPRLSARGVVKRFGATTALAGVDVDVAAGEAVAVMGPSGSGKSTLLHCLAGILAPDAGTVRLGGTDIGTLNERDRSLLRRRRLGFVFQFGQLLGELPAVENVALPLMLQGVARPDATRRAAEWLAALGLAGKEGRRPGELSGGEAQRVAVARALVTGPEVVFADEPTGALDQATGADVMRALTGATAAAGASLVLVTHDEQVAAWCSRRIHVRDGHVTDAAPGQAAAGPASGAAPGGSR
ncbi:ABC transporter ATP-binding protein [Cellulomonas cellasea]|uniref:Putative ABC transport system ATP-binding protein n=1 Tax=Cellulomonas cellasea TaxID=43670 RepID=A0A7W4YAT6_9CELL|nr:ABC transporter ATP-binding protein [Cellulomonas cellasea]MBB2923125.1 putative ABC transport system ATP-binding protein [Cellulomonas cellasea]